MRLFFSLLLLTIFIQPAMASDATMPGAQTGAAFMVIQNNADSAQADRLIGATSKISEIVEVHQNLIDPDDGKMMMRKIKGIDLPVGQEVALKPDGYHIMFIKMKESLTLNKQFPLTLMFEKAGEVKVDVNVMPPGVEPDGSMDLSENQQAAKNPVFAFFENLFKKKEQPVY